MELISILLLGVGLLLGFIIAYFYQKSQQHLSPDDAQALEQEREEALKTVSRLEERNMNLSDRLEDEQMEHRKAGERAHQAENKLAEINANYKNLQERLANKETEMKELQERFRDEFENLANKILDEKSKKFTKRNEEKIDQLLKPLGEKMEAFKKKVEETYEKEMRDNTSPKEQIKQMAELNKQMSEEAQNLTSALKGDSKTQGTWGEIKLDRILERSGLRKGLEYDTQVSKRDDENRLKQPDAVIYLPDEKYMVVDSKVSLKAYEQFASADDDNEKEKALKRHLSSIKSHARGLGEKNYQHLFEDKTPDFVLMFIPIESAFGAAFQTDPLLYNYAFERNIVIVSPSTLLATLATINNVWKRERQTQNAKKIAERGGKLYDKFVLFVESLQDVGMRIRQSQESYDTAMKRLKTGRGNLIGQADKLRNLGAPTTKELSDNLKGRPQLEDGEEE